VLIALLAAGTLAAAPANAPPGEQLYRRGLLPSGEPVRATREAGATLRGADAACVNCHRRSGLGSSEGRITIPPIAGPYLLIARGKSLEAQGVPFVDTERVNHEAYTEATLARAIREGIAANGKPLNYLMPRYQVDDATMAQLIEYLKDLKVIPAPGVSARELHFATIITPDADPVKRRGMLDVMRQYFVDKNNAVDRTKAPTLYSSHAMMFRVERRWHLHVWELKGAPATWETQLREHLATEPVFAVISGLGGAHWEPVQRFCEQAALPCLFPNTEAPAGHDSDFYTVYFSRGVLLEAELIARELADAKERPRRILQVYRTGDVGEAAARALKTTQADSALEVVNRPVGHSATDLATAVRQAGPEDALVLWLRPTDLSLLDHLAVPATRVWISGEMGGLEHAPLPPAWRAAAHVTYPVDLPGQRAVRVDYALSWFRLRKIPVVDQKVQADTYLACGLVSETINHIVDAFVREYLIERVEMALDHRVLTGYYPRLTLAPGQRFASKGGYIVRFPDPQGTRVTPVSEWIIP
jgi:Cytochrome c